MSDVHKALDVPPATMVATERMSPIATAALAILREHPDPETMRALFDLQREWEAGEAKRAYTRAMVDLKRDLPAVIVRDTTVDYATAKGRTHYTHASLAGAVAAVTEPLTAHGFSATWHPSTPSTMIVMVACRITHRDGHHEEVVISAPPDKSGSKSDAQAVASTITLLSRYTLLQLLGIATQDMLEPAGERTSTSGGVDGLRNLAAMRRLAKDFGRTKSAAEAHVGRPVAEWTGADLVRLRDWVAPPAAADIDDEAAAHDEEMAR